MKKVIVIATIITIAIIVSCACALPVHAETIYTLDTVVVGWELEYGNYKIDCLDENGDVWEFYDEEPWNIGDMVTLRLFAFDEDYTHDELLDVEYVGHLELHELAYYILDATGA